MVIEAPDTTEMYQSVENGGGVIAIYGTLHCCK